MSGLMETVELSAFISQKAEIQIDAGCDLSFQNVMLVLYGCHCD